MDREHPEDHYLLSENNCTKHYKENNATQQHAISTSRGIPKSPCISNNNILDRVTKCYIKRSSYDKRKWEAAACAWTLVWLVCHCVHIDLRCVTWICWLDKINFCSTSLYVIYIVSRSRKQVASLSWSPLSAWWYLIMVKTFIQCNREVT